MKKVKTPCKVFCIKKLQWFLLYVLPNGYGYQNTKYWPRLKIVQKKHKIKKSSSQRLCSSIHVFMSYLFKQSFKQISFFRLWACNFLTTKNNDDADDETEPNNLAITQKAYDQTNLSLR